MKRLLAIWLLLVTSAAQAQTGKPILLVASPALQGLYSQATLIGARAAQGLGAAVISPATLAILTTTFSEGRERNKALGVWGAVAGSGGAAGVLLGGVLTQGPGWEWVLWVNFPIGLIARSEMSVENVATRVADAVAIVIASDTVSAGSRRMTAWLKFFSSSLFVSFVFQLR